jgi:hypothetical protein
MILTTHLGINRCQGPQRPGRPSALCRIKNATWRADAAPWTYQDPPWGTAQWEALYKRRSSVERRNSMVKNPDIIGMSPGRLRWRGLPSVSILFALSWVAHNLYFRRLDE